MRLLPVATLHLQVIEGEKTDVENEGFELEERDALAEGQFLLGARDQLLRGHDTVLDEQPLPALLFVNGRRRGDGNLRTLRFVVGSAEDGKAARAGRRRGRRDR